jgi:hypothetical protein
VRSSKVLYLITLIKGLPNQRITKKEGVSLLGMTQVELLIEQGHLIEVQVKMKAKAKGWVAACSVPFIKVGPVPYVAPPQFEGVVTSCLTTRIGAGGSAKRKANFCSHVE